MQIEMGVHSLVKIQREIKSSLMFYHHKFFWGIHIRMQNELFYYPNSVCADGTWPRLGLLCVILPVTAPFVITLP